MGHCLKAVILETLRLQEERGDGDIDETDLARSGGFVGFVSFMEQQSLNCHSINLAAAEKGYGPMLYDIALSVISPGYLISDRQSVSKAAQNVWSYYFNNRSDVAKRIIDGADEIKNFGYLVSSSSVFSQKLGLEAILRTYYDIITKIVNIDYPRASVIPGEAPIIFSSEEKEQQRTKLEAEEEELEAEFAKRIIHNPLAYIYKIKRKKSLYHYLIIIRLFVLLPRLNIPEGN